MDWGLCFSGLGTGAAIRSWRPTRLRFCEAFRNSNCQYFRADRYFEAAFTEKGGKVGLQESDFLNELTYADAMPRVIEALEEAESAGDY